MQQDWLAGFLDDLIDREELLLVDGGAVDVGVSWLALAPSANTRSASLAAASGAFMGKEAA